MILPVVSAIALGLAAIVFIIVLATIREEIHMQTQAVTDLIAAFTAYKAAVDAKLSAIPGEITAAVSAATSDDAAAIAALTGQIQAATTAVGTP